MERNTQERKQRLQPRFLKETMENTYSREKKMKQDQAKNRTKTPPTYYTKFILESRTVITTTSIKLASHFMYISLLQR